ncbi:homoserine dehydrogenase [Catenisphaera adipataccumulans]|jgi:homoserine dehydrogenase|uniref:Homoserine dehydrogenase n=1 Tax=Catenisphaera adipataccumulans TaxID=700500 RepID=A0A7W8FXD7_9FIRM|nr:homoserine dehydrogenase [Catenisphaera adipataccumulans]MBB5182842.1 homoserine dehydrogenase [Catenisphaera adipataccumulans]
MKIAVLGYGTVGAGVVDVLTMNKGSITKRIGTEIDVKYVLDLRDFPGTIVENIVTHDIEDILNDPEVEIVVETMGGLKPAYEFTKRALSADKNVCTSNKELVAEHGVELCQIAAEHNVNYMFEASCGGGIPIIRALNTSLRQDEILEISGILNGTTNYIMTSMYDNGETFKEALKEAQEKGYAELHPEADLEGHDAQRKIAILSSLAYGHHLDYKKVPTEGIDQIRIQDIQYAKAMNMKIKLLATSQVAEEGTWAMVSPRLVDDQNILYHVDGVMNAVFVKGNALGDAMFYGSGAGSLPTASAVCADVLDCAQHPHETLKTDITAEPLAQMPTDQVKNTFFVRCSGGESQAKQVFGITDTMHVIDGEFGFWTPEMTEKDFTKKAAQVDGIIKFIRRG